MAHPKESRTQENGSARLVYLACLSRVCSTWLANKFADRPEIAYLFEPFHENLIAGTHSTLHRAFERLKFGRSLRHPPRTKHYHEAFQFQRGGGVRFFRKRFCYQDYHLDPSGNNHPLENYFSNLLETASQDGRQSFVKCTRSAFRARWLSSRFPGTYIYMFRSPRLIDNSHFSFRGYCNPYIRDYSLILGQNLHDPLLGEIAHWSGLDCYIADSLEQEYSHYRNILLRGRDGRYNRQYHFDCLCFFWAVALAEATRYADLIIDMDAMADQDVRTRTKTKIEEYTGIAVDLSDFNPDVRRIRRVHSRHRMTVSNEMLGIIRSAVAWVEPDWVQTLRFDLTDSTRQSIGFINCGVKSSGTCKRPPVVPWKEHPWLYAS